MGPRAGSRRSGCARAAPARGAWTSGAASTFKVAVLMAAHQLAAAGELRLDERIVVENRFASLVAGEFAVAEEDLDHWTHAQLGRSVPLSALLERMIVPSGNLATNLVL